MVGTVSRSWLVLCLLIALPLAGCLGASQGSSGPDAQGPADGDDDTDDLNYSNSSVRVRNGTQFVDDSQPHTHDYWSGKQSVTILDSAFSFLDRGTNVLRSTVKFQPAPGKSVLPGTARMEVTLSWDGAMSDQMHVSFYRPGPFTTLQNDTRLDNGETWSFPVPTEGWDVPHARRSLWQFRINRLRWYDHSTETVDVKITVHRTNRSLPLDPPHFDQFEGLDKKRLFSETYEDGDVAPLLDEVRGFPVLRFPRFGEAMDAVPWNAEKVHVKVTWAHTVPVPPPYQMRYKSAHDLSEQEAEPAQESDSSAVYVFQPTDEETDSQYAYNSLWEFTLYREDDPSAKIAPYPNARFRVEIWASRNGADPGLSA